MPRSVRYMLPEAKSYGALDALILTPVVGFHATVLRRSWDLEAIDNYLGIESGHQALHGNMQVQIRS